ncbi:hypothetical protein DL98DRAFT_624719, partial [Cadophora sp. DSE1049]
IIYSEVILTATYDHRLRRIGHPVRSAIHKFQIDRLVVEWVTISEYLLLYVFYFCCPVVLHPTAFAIVRRGNLWIPQVVRSQRRKLCLFQKRLYPEWLVSALPWKSPCAFKWRLPFKSLGLCASNLSLSSACTSLLGSYNPLSNISILIISSGMV